MTCSLSTPKLWQLVLWPDQGNWATALCLLAHISNLNLVHANWLMISDLGGRLWLGAWGLHMIWHPSDTPGENPATVQVHNWKVSLDEVNMALVSGAFYHPLSIRLPYFQVLYRSKTPFFWHPVASKEGWGQATGTIKAHLWSIDGDIPVTLLRAKQNRGDYIETVMSGGVKLNLKS